MKLFFKFRFKIESNLLNLLRTLCTDESIVLPRFIILCVEELFYRMGDILNV